MSAFAVYRLPHADRVTFLCQTQGEPEELSSCQQLNDRQGFVLAPFDIRQDQPILLIQPDEVLEWSVNSWEETSIDHELIHGRGHLLSPSASHFPPTLLPRESYAIDFANFHAQLESGAFRKIVLARCADETTSEPLAPVELFRQACERYPRMFIALVYTDRSGYWLTATPEILLENSRHLWHTIALAGTMKLEGDQLAGEGESVTWSTKNIEEQRIVATYITECLEQFTTDFREEGPRTARAADLVHLRSDFTFSLSDDTRLGDLLHALHPTPAVCGLPKRETYDFILRNEHTPRRYYSGFMGPLRLSLPPALGVGSALSTHLYVSLRCMNIEGNRYHLYAGGGLLKDSTAELEWLETEAKLQTMRSLIQ